MRHREVIYWVVAATQWICSLAMVSGMPVDGSDRSAEVRSALGELFADEHIAQQALQIHDRAMRLDDEARFEFLSRWVLPSADHSSLRMQCEFTQTCPAPFFEDTLSTATPVVKSEQRKFSGSNPVFAGGAMVSPAMDLVQVASRLNRLKEIQSRIAEWKTTSSEDQKSRAVFHLLIAIAKNEAASAEAMMREILSVAESSPGPAPERHAEALAVWAGGDFESTRELARDLAVQMQQECWTNRIPRSERWKRHITARRFLLDHIIDSRKSSVVEATKQPSMKSWIPVSRMISETRGAGYPIPIWSVTSGQARHIAGHDHDYLYFASPLTGNFSVEADLSTFEYRDIHLAFGNYWAGSNSDCNICLNGSFRYDGIQYPLDPPLTRMLESQRVRIKFENNIRTTLTNGRSIYPRQHAPDGDPWLSIHSWWLTNGTVKNLRVLGEPVIPEEISMITADLAGWIAYFDESVGWQNADWIAKVAPTKVPATNQSAIQSPDQSAAELVGRRRPEREGLLCESLLRYHRPMVEDGTIAYEFFYEPGISLVHPALDRLAMMLHPSGVRVHWITDGRHDSTSFLPDNLEPTAENASSATSLPLKPNDWNKATLSTKGDVVHLMINDTLVFSRELEATNLRTFGLFHYADQTEVRVRNLRWRGEWPRTLSVPAEQELAVSDVDELLKQGDALPLIYDHDFRNGLPPGLFSVVGDKWEENLQQVENGVRLNRPGGEYVNYAIYSPVVLSGDFDLTTSFEDYDSETEVDGGESNIQLAVTLADDRSRDCFLFRKTYGVLPGTREQLVQAAIFEKRGGETQFLFFNNPAEESTSGRMRIIRLGDRMSFLYAEDQSTEFRLIHSEIVSNSDANVKLVVGQHKAGYSRVVWKTLKVRAKSAVGAPDTIDKSLEQLDSERTTLADERTYNFATAKPVSSVAALKGFTIWQHPSATYESDDKGLTISVPGSENWQAAGLVPNIVIEGDFDISLALDVLHLEASKMYDESVVLLQAEFNDKLKSNSEVKFSIHQGGDRKAETQRRRLRSDGTFHYQEIVSQPETTASLLRLARRGDMIYQIFQAEPDSAPKILGVMKIGKDPVPVGLLRALIHTGGENRKTVIRFRSLQIHAEKIADG